MLNTYLAATQNLLQNPTAPTALYSTANLTTYINTARNQLAGESECLPYIGSLALSAGTQIYPFSSITLTGASTAGISQPIKVRALWCQIASGQSWMRPRGWPWFELYELNNPVPPQGMPAVWTQYGQSVNGTIYVSPIPDQAYTANVDCVCLPVALVDDTTVEAIPALWQDAIPYYAAYLALLSAQTGIRAAEAEKMFGYYQEFVKRARRAATPSILPTLYSQVQSPVRANQLGLQGGGG